MKGRESITKTTRAISTRALERGFWRRNNSRQDPRADAAAASFSRLALQLERDLASRDRGCSVLIAAADDDAVGVETTTELGWSLAEELGHNVLLVDATFGRRTLSTALGRRDDPGLLELLDGCSLSADVVREAARSTQNNDIKLLPSGFGDNGRLIPARAEVLQQFLDAACETFDFVLVQGSVVSDGGRSLAFGSLVDGVLLVAVEGKTRLTAVEHAQRALNDCGAERVGLVLANPPGRRFGQWT